MIEMTPNATASLAAGIREWYDQNRRPLPWRGSRDPYHIWVSEAMLQQTQVETVIPYFLRFVRRFPTVAALAAAPLEEVLKAWENLGYYARARNLHAAARKVVNEMNGRLPDRWDALISLPGIGPYTAGAILSIAFGERTPAIDANVRRVLCRIFAVLPADRQTGKDSQLRHLAESILPEQEPGRFNEALMDLGATICTPQAPRCPACPARSWCRAYELGLQSALPPKRKRVPIPHVEMTAGILRDPQGRLLIVRRSAEGLLGGLWKFPGGRRQPPESLTDSLQRHIREELAIEVDVHSRLASVDHAFSHFRVTLHAFACDQHATGPRSGAGTEGTWADRQELQRLPFSKVDRKIMAAVGVAGAATPPYRFLSNP
jgi:A/G-specific adenine glycosylase